MSAKWLDKPTSRTPGAAVSAATAAARSSSRTPWRLTPVSTLRWTRSARSSRAAAATAGHAFRRAHRDLAIRRGSSRHLARRERAEHQHRRPEAGAAQAQRLVQRMHAEHVGAAGEERPAPPARDRGRSRRPSPPRAGAPAGARATATAAHCDAAPRCRPRGAASRPHPCPDASSIGLSFAHGNTTAPGPAPSPHRDGRGMACQAAGAPREAPVRTGPLSRARPPASGARNRRDPGRPRTVRGGGGRS